MPGAGDATGSASMVPTMLGSALSGMLARIPCHPLDTCKSRIQAQGTLSAEAPFRNVWHALTKTARTEGIAGLYRGFGVTFLGSAPAACLYFTMYERSKQALTSTGIHPALVHLSAGMFAETASCVLWVPIDVVKERMQIQRVIKNVSSPAAVGSPPVFRNGWHAMSSIVKSEGVTGFYRGYGATVLSFGPFSALFFLFHERFKKMLLDRVPKDSTFANSAFGVAATSGAAAGGVASFLTNPLELVKLRLQVQRGLVAQGEQAPYMYRNVVHGLRSVVRDEGARGLLRGVGARVFFHVPATAISIGLFEECRSMVARSLGYPEPDSSNR